MKITSFLLACVACGTLTYSNQVFSQPSASPRLQTEEGRIFLNILERSYQLVLLHPAQAIEELDYALRSDSDWEAYAVRAMAHERLGNYEQAIADYSTALDSQLYNLKVIRTIYKARGRAYADVEKHDLAVKDFTQILDNVMEVYDSDLNRANPDEQELVVNAYLARGKSYEALKQYNLAMEDYQRASELRPDNAVAMRLKASLLNRLGGKQ